MKEEGCIRGPVNAKSIEYVVIIVIIQYLHKVVYESSEFDKLRWNIVGFSSNYKLIAKIVFYSIIAYAFVHTATTRIIDHFQCNNFSSVIFRAFP